MLALLSDLHANARALDACLAHARASGATQYAILGDLVGYGAEPAAVLDTVMALAAEGAVVLRGNHDEATCAAPVARINDDIPTDEVSAQWTRGQITAQHRRFITQLPLSAQVGSSLVVHASADAPMEWHYVDTLHRAELCLKAATERPGVQQVFVGHIHRQRFYYRSSRSGLMEFEPVPGVAFPIPAQRHWLATVGSVGQPRDGDPRAMYALYDEATRRLVFHGVEYDHLAAAAAIRASGQPVFFATRLESGR